ncbi:hypothetical protein LTR37_006422 [Vermiconidia calcicola]|uniref:Uncharacterized protein n=1 Tax=Vermiconidia calcicola TaxID=1690605 RepID=A0ACC3NHL3_9PEZI|nr:hypothetical protein LTR37_006422 [Vermiconidia calcicola]
MPTQSSRFNSAFKDYDHEQEEQYDSPSTRPLSGPGTSRQSRRLQLRNSGFRGAALPTRKVTPKSMSSSNWSSVSGFPGSSDNENMSLTGARRSTPVNEKRASSGVLQEIGNSTLTRPKKPRPRMSSSKLFATEPSTHEAVYAGMPTSPPPSKTTLRPRAVKNRAKVSHQRRSISTEASKYIEHLETELELSRINSPSTTRVQSSKMRNLNTETRQLQKELADWEERYEQRVQEEVDKHFEIESGLRSQIRSLEQEAEETKFKMEELETQLETTVQNMEAVETANVNLEKRIEIMSELLTASPTKIDLHAQTPGRAKKHVRPKSMLPRFPTASSLMGSPERQPQTQPTSPLLQFSSGSPVLQASSSNDVFTALNYSPEQSDDISEVESVFSEASATGDSMTSAENFELPPSFNPWNMPPPENSRSRPMRRMRRFGAGSVGPKPLILPYTSHCEHLPPTSAPPLERSETSPAIFTLLDSSSRESDNVLPERRRASTIANEMRSASLAASPFPNVELEDVAEMTMMSLSSPPSAQSPATTRYFSSVGPTAGRNLMEELTAVCTDQSTSSLSQTCPPRDGSDQVDDDGYFPLGSSDANGSTTLVPQLAIPVAKTSQASSASSPTIPSPPAHRWSSSRSLSTPVGPSISVFDRLRALFGDLWRSPLDVARYLVQTAQARMRIPQRLVNVQWWLVGVLLGPMAKRRILSHTGCCNDLEEQPLLLEGTPHRDAEVDIMAYGTLHESPSTPARRLAAGGTNGARISKRCPHNRAKHSPLVWIKFSLTLAFAIGAAFKDGPASLLKTATRDPSGRVLLEDGRARTPS